MRRKVRVQIAVATLSGNSFRQTVHTHCASVHQAAKLLAALLRVARVTTGLAESNGSLPPGLWLTSPAGWLPRTGISSESLCSVIEYGLPLPFLDTCNISLFNGHVSRDGVLPCRRYVSRECGHWPFSRLSRSRCWLTVHQYQSPSASWYEGVHKVSSNDWAVQATPQWPGDDPV